MLIALEEVENALVAYRQAQLRLHQLAQAEKAQQRAVVLAHDRYRSGLVDFLDVLESERSLYNSQAYLAQGERAMSQNLVRLYKALGGGWEEDLAWEHGKGARNQRIALEIMSSKV